jgi:hypothetical protein
MNPIFWTVAAIDAMLFIAIFISAFMQNSAGSSGGREMAMFFFAIVPGIILLFAVLLFVYSRTPLWRGVALLIVTVPCLLFGYSQLRNIYIDHAVAQNQLGRG